jgi:outer membrane protein OmpA-like peptidoglycan-associated protein
MPLAPAKTRGFDPRAHAREAAQKELNAKLRDFKTRQITVEERDHVAKLIEESKSPNVDVQIFFAFDPTEILPEARLALDELGKALLRRGAAQEQGRSFRRREPAREDRQHRKCQCGRRAS